MLLNGPDNPKIAPFCREIWISIQYMVPWAHPKLSSICILIGSAIFAGLTNRTNRQTDRYIHRQTTLFPFVAIWLVGV